MLAEIGIGEFYWFAGKQWRFALATFGGIGWLVGGHPVDSRAGWTNNLVGHGRGLWEVAVLENIWGEGWGIARG